MATPSLTGRHRAAHDAHFKHKSLAKFCYFMMGCGFLCGWNAFLTATDFFNAAFPGRSIDRVFTIVYLPITLSLIGLVTRFPRIFFSSRVRILTGYTLFTFSTAMIPVIDAALINGHAAGGSVEAAYGLVLAAVVLVAIGDGITQGTVYGDSALLPDQYTQSVVMGAAASGVVIGVIRIVTKGALPQTKAGLRISTQIYFACSASITAACLVLYELVMPRLDVIQYYRGKLADERQLAELEARRCASDGSRCSSPASRVLSRDSFINISVTGERLQGLVRSDHSATASPRATSPKSSDTAAAAAATAAAAAGGGRSDTTAAPAAPAPASKIGKDCHEASPARERDADGAIDKLGDVEGSRFVDDEEAQEIGPLTWIGILKLNWRLCVAVFILYAVTLSIFPGFLAENVHSAVLKDWYPVLLIFTFNIFDFLGRCTPHFNWIPRHTTLLLLSLGRLVVLEVLFPVLSVKGAGEAAFFILTLLLGVTNGYLTTLIFTAAPRGLSPSAAELAGGVNVFCELSGLMVGAYLGWLWTVGKA